MIVHSFNIFQTDGDYGKLSHIFFTEFSVFGDFQAVKYCWICPDFKECLQHVHVQSFSKASWAGDKVYFAPVLDKAVDHFCFIDIIEVVFDYFFKIVYSYRKFLFFLALRFLPKQKWFHDIIIYYEYDIMKPFSRKVILPGEETLRLLRGNMTGIRHCHFYKL